MTKLPSKELTHARELIDQAKVDEDYKRSLMLSEKQGFKHFIQYHSRGLLPYGF